MTITYEGIKNDRRGEVGRGETLTFLFCSDNQNPNPKVSDNITDVLWHPDCPRKGSVHPQLPWMFVKRQQYREAPGKWEVVCEYAALKKGEQKPDEQKPPTEGDPQPEPEPVDDEELETFDGSARMSLGFEEFTAPATGHHNDSTAFADPRNNGSLVQPGNPIVYSNLELVDPPPEVYKNTPIIDIRKAVKIDDFVTYRDLIFMNNTINTRKLAIGEWGMKIPKYGARMRVSIGETQFAFEAKKLIQYREVDVQLLIRFDGWRSRLLDIGTYGWDKAGKTVEQRAVDSDWNPPAPPLVTTTFTDDDGNIVAKSLDGTGQQDKQITSPVFNEYRLYREQDHLKVLRSISDFMITAG